MTDTYNKAYKFRLLPTKEQESFFVNNFGCARFVWNQMLDYSTKYYEEHKKSGTISAAALKKQNPWLKEADSLGLDIISIFMKRAFQAFFAKRSSYPRFKSKKDTRQSYTTRQMRGSNTIRIVNDAIKLPKVGYVKLIKHREFKAGEFIKNCTISLSAAGKYYVSIIVEGISTVKPINPLDEKIIGLDFSFSDLFVTSNGEKANCPYFYQESEEKLKKLHKSLSRKKKGSNNRQKARLKLARFYDNIACKRKDFLHKLSYKIATAYDVVIVQDINIRSVVEGSTISKPVLDNGWGMFLEFLKYKLLERGKQFIKIPPLSTENLILEGSVENALKIRTAGMVGIAW